METRTFTQMLAAMLKLGVCAVTILAIGWGILVLDGSEIQEATADILALSPAPMTNTARLENSLDALGHSEPRVYDFNGNEVGFSTRYIQGKKPKRIIEEYQREFVRQGLNEEMYVDDPGKGMDPSSPDYLQEGAEAASKRVEAMMSGQIVPLEVHDSYASMGAGLIAGKPTTRRDLNNQLANPSTDNFDELFAGYRKIEIFRDPDSGATSVTAAWSRGDFDMKKHRPERYADRRGVNPSTTIPACMGCTRLMKFDGETNAKPDGVNIFATPQNRHDVADFYDEAMANRGWHRTTTNQMLGRLLDGTADVESGTLFRQYRKGNREVSIRIRHAPALDKTTVTAYESNEPSPSSQQAN